jgi:hypothetical protein
MYLLSGELNPLYLLIKISENQISDFAVHKINNSAPKQHNYFIMSLGILWLNVLGADNMLLFLRFSRIKCVSYSV